MGACANIALNGCPSAAARFWDESAGPSLLAAWQAAVLSTPGPMDSSSLWSIGVAALQALARGRDRHAPPTQFQQQREIL
jgi:hypothetical protein